MSSSFSEDSRPDAVRLPQAWKGSGSLRVPEPDFAGSDFVARTASRSGGALFSLLVGIFSTAVFAFFLNGPGQGLEGYLHGAFQRLKGPLALDDRVKVVEIDLPGGAGEEGEKALLEALNGLLREKPAALALMPGLLAGGSVQDTGSRKVSKPWRKVLAHPKVAVGLAAGPENRKGGGESPEDEARAPGSTLNLGEDRYGALYRAEAFGFPKVEAESSPPIAEALATDGGRERNTPVNWALFPPSPPAGPSLPLFYRCGAKAFGEEVLLPSLPFEAVRLALGQHFSGLAVVPRGGVLLGRNFVPLDARGIYRIRYPAKDGITRVDGSREGSSLKGALLFVDRKGAPQGAFRPFGERLGPAEFSAAMASNLLLGRGVTRPGWALPLSLGIAFLSFLFILAPRFGLLPKALGLTAGMLSALFFTGICALFFVRQSLDLPAAWPLLAAAGALTAYLPLRRKKDADAFGGGSRPEFAGPGFSRSEAEAQVGARSPGDPAASAWEDGHFSRPAAAPSQPARVRAAAGERRGATLFFEREGIRERESASPPPAVEVPGRALSEPVRRPEPEGRAERDGAAQREERPEGEEPPKRGDLEPRDAAAPSESAAERESRAGNENRPEKAAGPDIRVLRRDALPSQDLEFDEKGVLTRIGKYRLVRKLGKGSAGDVFEGFDMRMERKVAVKTVTKNAFSHFDHALERFEVEAKAAGSLNHPHINAIYDFGSVRNVSYMVLEYLDGMTLSHYLKNHPVPSLGACLPWIAQMAGALDYAHAHHIIHRDFKPGNLMLVENLSVVKLLDFGIAKMEDVMLTRTGMTVGTPSYMSPEQLLGTTLTAASDQYALAVVIYQMLSHRLPYHGTKIPELCNRILKGEIIPLPESNPEVPEAVWEALRRSFAKSPEERYPDCAALHAALKIASA